MKKKNNNSGFSHFLGSLRDYAPLFIFLALVSNIFIVYRFESTRKPQVVYSVERVFVNTNVSSSASVPVSPASVPVSSSNVVSRASSSNVVDRTVCNVSYDYFLYNGVRGVKMWDRFYNEGSLTSFGRISTIFPDRILLEDGGYIVNQKWIGGHSQPANKGVL